MATQTSSFEPTSLEIGAVFTPLRWAEFAIERFGLFEKWLAGATVFDPTMGEGNLLEALILCGRKRGIALENLPVGNLFGMELNARFFQAACAKLIGRFGVPAKNLTCGDIFSQPNTRRFDFIFGNPPWANFADLPDGYKEGLKPLFPKFDLVANRQDLLLGGSRIDVAALVIQKTILESLRPGGEAVFFMPLSLLLNDGANRQFRTYKIGDTPFCVSEVFDFQGLDVFEKVSTRHGLAHFRRDERQVFPLKFYSWESGDWQHRDAAPVFHPTDPLSVEPEGHAFSAAIRPISLPRESAPRQGLNTCGANDVFFFDACQEVDETTCAVGPDGEVLLPKRYLFPLITGKNFRETQPVPHKWALIPHAPSGKPLELADLQREPLLLDYLQKHRDILQNRKGSMLGSWLKRGQWWALLGVGPYNFFPHKVVWEAYGRSDFRPRIFPGNWQANQSLQAFIPLRTHELAVRVHARLREKHIEDYLRSLKMDGTMNWAQPGKISRFVQFEEEAMTLFA